MHLLWTILIGFVIGIIARALKPGRDAIGFVMTVIIGVGGALLAKFVGEQMGWYAEGQKASFIAAVGGALVLLVVYEMFQRMKAKKQAE